MPALDPNQSILIVGAGTFGLSTALHLAWTGYKNITVVDRSSTLPSTYSAGNDLNKIVRAEYEDDWYTELALVGNQQSIKIPTHCNVLGSKN